MFSRSILGDFRQALRSDPFWLFRYFGWFYFHWSGSSMTYGIIFSGLVTVLHFASSIFYADSFVSHFVKSAESKVTFVLQYFAIVSGTLDVPFLVIVWITRGNRRIQRVISSIAIIDEKLSHFGQCPSKNSTVWKLSLLTCLPVILIEGFTWPFIGQMVQFNSQMSRAIWLFWSNFRQLVGIYTHGLFACLAYVLGERYKAVNTVLKKMNQEHSYDFRNNSQFNFDWMIRVRELRAIHRKLYFLAEKISEAFGVQILIMTIASLFTVIEDLYKLYWMTAVPCDSSPFRTIECVIWCWIHIGPFFIAAFCCSWTVAQEKQTVVSLQEMNVVDENLRMELIHYDLYFSACGFYNIDLSVTQTIAGTIATYLVILIQLGTVPRECQFSSFPTSGYTSNFSANYYSENN